MLFFIGKLHHRGSSKEYIPARIYMFVLMYVNHTNTDLFKIKLVLAEEHGSGMEHRSCWWLMVCRQQVYAQVWNAIFAI